MAVTVPSDRRFRRASTRPARHARIKYRWWWMVLRSTCVLGLLAFGGYRAAVFAVSADTLTVREVRVSGNQRLSRGEAAALLDGLRGENILTTDLGRWRERLLASAWVEDAELRRRLPGTVDVKIVERQPAGIARRRGELFLVDEAGAVIDEFGPRYADCDLPIIDGLFASPANGGRTDGVRRQAVADLIADLARRPEIARRVSQIDVSDPNDLRVILAGDSAVIHLGDARFTDRIRSYVELQSALRERVPAIDYVDLRFDDRVYVGPAPTLLASSVGAGPSSSGDVPGRAPSGRPGRQ